jgi:hypothetical protein
MQEFKIRMENCEIRKKELKNKEMSLKTAVLKYNSFIKVC